VREASGSFMLFACHVNVLKGERLIVSILTEVGLVSSATAP